MNLRKIDLNLLVMFDALMSEGSVAAAALKVGITPSAMSHALGRLRRTLNDDIFRRTPRGMVATRRACQLAQRTRGLLKDIDRAFSEQLEFDPKTSERSFRIRLSDYLVGCLMPRTCVRLRREAPRLTVAGTICRYPVRSKERTLAISRSGSVQNPRPTLISDRNGCSRTASCSPCAPAIHPWGDR
jgi:DNA-binding transcriptional LysR family regulator